ncbi:hypothetical protein FCK90_08770 [Kocuria coralli]|uniref:Uncharacterized protein n=1 Tax=Kocuria coralli TaxID=1461025 RepID=A0A5J5KYV3_9MICC|nr:hypothetical protein [Kocuria coralli]KAA9394006.1 hypothetical protein FCK90_08770 [Kocuria coralli]
MVRKYQRKTDRPAATRPVRVRYQRREEIDAEKVAEVLIRIALRHADDDSDTGRTGDYLRDLLTTSR